MRECQLLCQACVTPVAALRPTMADFHTEALAGLSPGADTGKSYT